MNQVQAFSFVVSWSRGIFPYAISVSVGRDASEIVVDDMGVWATCWYSYLTPPVLLVLDLSLPYKSFLLGPFALRIWWVRQNPAHDEQLWPHTLLVSHDQLALFLPGPSSTLGVVFQRHIILWRWHGLSPKLQESALWLSHEICHQSHMAAFPTITTFNTIGYSGHRAK